ncbi:MAG: antitoxin MazE5 [Ilumatobacteraceae bacterium]
MPRVRLSTTVDQALLAHARAAVGAANDATLVDEALRALLDRRRSAEIDAVYASAYVTHPFDEPDEWGDLMSFSDAVKR